MSGAAMRWTERQAQMLDELGIRLPPVPAPAGDAAPPQAEARSVTRAAEVVEVSPPPPARGDRPAGVDAMDWDTLRRAVADCAACKLCQGRRQTVFGVGHPNAHWMIVG